MRIHNLQVCQPLATTASFLDILQKWLKHPALLMSGFVGLVVGNARIEQVFDPPMSPIRNPSHYPVWRPWRKSRRKGVGMRVQARRGQAVDPFRRPFVRVSNSGSTVDTCRPAANKDAKVKIAIHANIFICKTIYNCTCFLTSCDVQLTCVRSFHFCVNMKLQNQYSSNNPADLLKTLHLWFLLISAVLEAFGNVRYLK